MLSKGSYEFLCKNYFSLSHILIFFVFFLIRRNSLKRKWSLVIIFVCVKNLFAVSLWLVEKKGLNTCLPIHTRSIKIHETRSQHSVDFSEQRSIALPTTWSSAAPSSLHSILATCTNDSYNWDLMIEKSLLHVSVKAVSKSQIMIVSLIDVENVHFPRDFFELINQVSLFYYYIVVSFRVLDQLIVKNCVSLYLVMCWCSTSLYSFPDIKGS